MSGAAPYLLLAALIWATTRAGGSTPVDLMVLATALLAAFVLAGRPSRPGPALLAVGAFATWTVVSHPHQVFDPPGLRLPAVVVLGTLAVLVARRCSAAQRAVVLDGLVVIGTAQALGALVQAVATVAQQGVPPGGLRAASMLGNANALGVLLVATLLVTLRTRPTGWPVALVIQAVGVLLAGSRLALVVGLVVSVWATARGPLRRWWAAVICWAIAAVAVTVGRFAATGADRLALWRGVLDDVARAPITGRGPAPVLYQVAGIGPTTSAHNEALQVTVEYGLVGLGFLVVAGVLVARSVRGGDHLLLAATGALAASGLTDFGLRIPAVALTGAVLGATAGAARSGRARPPSGPRATAAAPPRAGGPGSASGSRRAGVAGRGSGARS